MTPQQEYQAFVYELLPPADGNEWRKRCRYCGVVRYSWAGFWPKDHARGCPRPSFAEFLAKHAAAEALRDVRAPFFVHGEAIDCPCERCEDKRRSALIRSDRSLAAHGLSPKREDMSI